MKLFNNSAVLGFFSLILSKKQSKAFQVTNTQLQSEQTKPPSRFQPHTPMPICCRLANDNHYLEALGPELFEIATEGPDWALDTAEEVEVILKSHDNMTDEEVKQTLDSYLSQNHIIGLVLMLKTHRLTASDQTNIVEHLLHHAPKTYLNNINDLLLDQEVRLDSLEYLAHMKPQLIIDSFYNLSTNETEQLALLEDLIQRYPRLITPELKKLNLPKDVNAKIIKTIARSTPNILDSHFPGGLIRDLDPEQRLDIAEAALDGIPNTIRARGRPVSAAQIHMLLKIAYELAQPENNPLYYGFDFISPKELLDEDTLSSLINAILDAHHPPDMMTGSRIFEQFYEGHIDPDQKKLATAFERRFKSYETTSKPFGLLLSLMELEGKISLTKAEREKVDAIFGCFKKMSSPRLGQTISFLTDLYHSSLTSDTKKSMLLSMCEALDGVSKKKLDKKLCFLASIAKSLMKINQFGDERLNKFLKKIPKDTNDQKALLRYLAVYTLQLPESALLESDPLKEFLSNEESAAAFIHLLTRLGNDETTIPAYKGLIKAARSHFLPLDSDQVSHENDLHAQALSKYCPNEHLAFQAADKIIEENKEAGCKATFKTDFMSKAEFGTKISHSCQSWFERNSVVSAIQGTINDKDRHIAVCENTKNEHWFCRATVDMVFDAAAFEERGEYIPLLLVNPLYENSDCKPEHRETLYQNLRKLSATSGMDFCKKGQAFIRLPKNIGSTYCDQYRGRIATDTQTRTLMRLDPCYPANPNVNTTSFNFFTSA